ncbi:Probable Co/Zn/Cd efflux system membrane fusion protein [hydrothermal vent metagenome]|uniref:Probable Co/Zn/Cd efflux system membrane fusion protein n=1 Tax=hydrothermal vent metagenome TaxID=652676 RepID=A0A3B0YXU2_9ZZZZ
MLLLVAMFGAIFGWKYYAGQQMMVKMSVPQPPAVIAAAEVEVDRWQPYLNAIGSVTAIQGISVTTEIAGQVAEIFAKSGQRVEVGEVLLRLNDSVDQADLKGLKSQRTLARLQLERIQKLLKTKSTSRSELDVARAKLDAAEAAVAAKQATIDKKTIRAPFTGQLGIADINLGQYLSPGTAIVPLESLDPVYVDYTLPERYLGDVAVGQAIQVTVQAWAEQQFDGVVSAIDPGIDIGTRSVKLRATLANPALLLRPGMFAQVRTVLPQREGILTLPRTAITYNPYGETVFVVVEKEGKLVVQSRPVDTGEVRDGRVEVVKGLKAGERVVSAGHNKLRNGQAVSIDNSVELDGKVNGG